MHWRCLIAVLAAAASYSAELPAFYKHVSRVVWVVKSIDAPLRGWKQLGLSNVREYGSITAVGQYKGRPVSIRMKQASGNLGDLTIETIQPEGGENAFTDFLARHGNGIFAIVSEVSAEEEGANEAARMKELGVPVLQQVTSREGDASAAYTFFDTEPQGKYVLGLLYAPAAAPPAGKPGVVSHIAPVARESEGPSAFWEKLGFPPLKRSHATPREDSRYRGEPLLLSFDVCWQRHSQFTLEWIIPPLSPPNIYADFLRMHGEGIQHIGVPVPDLNQAIADYKKLGYSVWQSGAWGDVGKKGSGQYAYMDTNSIGGVAVELIHAYQ